MPDNSEGPRGAPKPPPAAIPDLKKALENKPAGFAWSPGAARSAASAPILKAPPPAPTALERLNSTPGRLAVLAVLMLIGGAGLSFTAFQGSAGGGAGALGGIKSTIKSRAFQGRDSVGFNKGYGAGNGPAARKSGMNFDLIKAGEKDPLAVEMPEIPGDPGAEGDAPMNSDEGSASRAGAAGGGASAGADGGAGSEDGGLAGGAAPRLGSSYGKINFQGMRRVSGTAGFRTIKASAPGKTIKTRGSAANSAGAAGRGGSGSASSPLTPFSGNDPRSAGIAAGRSSAAGSGAAAGGGGGGGGVNVDGLEETVEQNLPSVPDLLAEAASKRKAAEKEEKKAKQLAVGGHLAQAQYHYKRAEKKKEEAEGLENQANQQINAIKDETDGLTDPAPIEEP